MNNVIVTGLLVVAAVTAAAIAISTILPSIHSSSQSVVQANHEVASRIGTDISIIAIGTDYEGHNIDAWVKNVGIEPIEPLNLLDIILIRPDQHIDVLAYDRQGIFGTWKEDPETSTLIRGRTTHLKLVLPEGSPLMEGIHYLRVSTPNGIVTEKMFSK